MEGGRKLSLKEGRDWGLPQMGLALYPPPLPVLNIPERPLAAGLMRGLSSSEGVCQPPWVPLRELPPTSLQLGLGSAGLMGLPSPSSQPRDIVTPKTLQQ